MADNLAVKDGTGAAKSLRTKETTTDIHQPYHGVLDGEDVALGAKADAAVTNPASSGSLIALAKGLLTYLSGYLTTRGYGFDVAVTPTVTAGAYSAGDIMGALMTFAVARANDEPVVITGVQVVCKAAVTPALTLVLLNANPTSTTKTDNSAWSLNAADAFKVIGAVALTSSWTDHGTPNSIRADNLNIVAEPASGTQNIYGILVDGTGVTLTSTSDIQVRLRGVGC